MKPILLTFLLIASTTQLTSADLPHLGANFTLKANIYDRVNNQSFVPYFHSVENILPQGCENYATYNCSESPYKCYQNSSQPIDSQNVFSTFNGTQGYYETEILGFKGNLSVNIASSCDDVSVFPVDTMAIGVLGFGIGGDVLKTMNSTKFSLYLSNMTTTYNKKKEYDTGLILFDDYLTLKATPPLPQTFTNVSSSWEMTVEKVVIGTSTIGKNIKVMFNPNYESTFLPPDIYQAYFEYLTDSGFNCSSGQIMVCNSTIQTQYMPGIVLSQGSQQITIAGSVSPGNQVENFIAMTTDEFYEVDTVNVTQGYGDMIILGMNSLYQYYTVFDFSDEQHPKIIFNQKNQIWGDSSTWWYFLLIGVIVMGVLVVGIYYGCKCTKKSVGDDESDSSNTSLEVYINPQK